MNIQSSAPQGHCQNRRKHALPLISDLRAKFTYDPDTGHLFTKRGRVGSLGSQGYFHVKYSSKPRLSLRSHRVAFAIMRGYWPNILHHDNGDKADNRWCNLREVSNRQNMRSETCLGKNPFGITPDGLSFKLSFRFRGKTKTSHFTLWRDALAFRRYLDRGFEREGDAFQPVIPPRSVRIIPDIRDAMKRLRGQKSGGA